MRALSLPSAVTIVEVGPRDGLQNEPVALDTGLKVAFIERLADAGLPVLEVTAFVNPARVPQMADAAAVAAALRRRPGTRYSALVPNRRGLEAALGAGLDEVAIFAATSDTFSRRNINQDVDASLAAYAALTRDALDAGLRVRGYLSTAFGCPFEGAVAPERVAEVAARLADMGVYEVAVSDTTGIAHPGQVEPVVASVASRIGLDRVALHLHDTRGTALANVLVGLACGVTTFDASAGGLGGCPFAPGAAGNLATEDLVYALDGLGVRTGVSLGGVVEASRQVEPALGHLLPSRFYRAQAASRH
jgi:isopropylmalate/homocitrate/citramalate synthase